MSDPNYPALLKLARFLERLPRRKFVFNRTVAASKLGCGTVCCAIGWCPAVFPKRAKWNILRGPHPVAVDGVDGNWFDNGERLFTLSQQESRALFTPGKQLPWLENVTIYSDESGLDLFRAGDFPATPKNVAQSIRAFVKWRRDGTVTAPAKVLRKARKS